MKKALLICLCLCILAGLSAQTITLENSIATALENNADIQKQALALEQARKTASNQWNLFLPSLSVSANYGNAGHQIAPSATDGNWDWGASASASISGIGLHVPSAIKIAQLDYDIALHNYEQLVKNIETSVAASFYGLISAKENITILQDSLELAEEEYEQVTDRYNAGIASELDLLRAQYSYESAGPALREAASNYRTQIADFLILLGVEPESTPSEITGTYSHVEIDSTLEIVELELPKLAELADLYTNNTADVLSKTYSLERSELYALSSKLSSYGPTITLSENLNLVEDNITSDLSVNGSFSISARLPLDSIIPGSSGALNLDKLDDAIVSAEIDLDTALLNAGQNIIEKSTDIRRLWEDIQTANLNFSIVERTYELSQESYQNGLLTQTDLEDARQNFTSANQALINAEISYINGTYALANALNIDIEELYELYGKSTTIADSNRIQVGEING